MTTNTNSMDNHGVAFHFLPRRPQSTEMVPCERHEGLVEAADAAINGAWICRNCRATRKEREDVTR